MSIGTITLQTIVNLASTHTDLLPISGVGGFSNEPALSLCNDTLQELLASGEFAWKFNQRSLGLGAGVVGPTVGSFLVTQMNKQDYLFGGACVFTQNGGAALNLATASTPGITISGSTATANTLEPHGFNQGDTVYLFGTVKASDGTASGLDSVLTQTSSSWTYSGGYAILSTPTPTSFTFTVTGSPVTSGAPGIKDFGWLQSATMVQINNTSPLMNVKQLQTYRFLPISPRVNNPTKISFQTDNYDGTVTVRFTDVPGGTIWGAAPIYQAKAPLKTALTQTWDPFPDELSFVYRQMFLARAYRYVKSPDAQIEQQQANAAILKGLGLRDAEMSDEHFAPERSFLEF